MYQQTTGITTEVNTLLPETRLVDRFCIAAAAPPVSHHLNQQLPVSLFSHSHVASNIYIIIPYYLFVKSFLIFFFNLSYNLVFGFVLCLSTIASVSGSPVGGIAFALAGSSFLYLFAFFP